MRRLCEAASRILGGDLVRTAGTAVLAVTVLSGLSAGVASSAPSDSPAGLWKGALAVGGTELHLVFHVEGETADSLEVTLDSPDQGAFGLATANVAYLDRVFSFDLPVAGGTFRGVLSDPATLSGVWSQGGSSFPLVMRKVAGKTAGASTEASDGPNRPQTPVPPFPYGRDPVRFENRAAGLRLAGTLTLPPGEGPFPAVVLVTGSGPQDRDETLFGHKPFLVIADRLARAGVAALRYDDRGVGESEGVFGDATTRDLAADASAAVTFLASRSEVDPEAIGIVGHSEGGLIGPLVALENPRVSFLVLLAGPAVRGRELLLRQNRDLAVASGMPDSLVAAIDYANAALYDRVLAARDSSAIASGVHEALVALRGRFPPGEQAALGLTVDRESALIRQLTSPWIREFLAYDPAETLKRLRLPVLALYGSKDLQVSAELDSTALRKACKAAEIVVFPGLNHLFQHAQTGRVEEYGRIEETVAPEVLDRLETWIAARARP